MEKVLRYVPILLLTLLLYIFLRRRNRRDPSKRHNKLPPGSMGWPYVGETLQLYSQDPNVFFATKQRRFFLSLHMWFSILTFLISRFTFSCFTDYCMTLNAGFAFSNFCLGMVKSSRPIFLVAGVLC